MSIRLGVRYEGNGYFKAISRHALEEAEQNFTKGETVNAELRRPRSTSQNNFFHGLCEAAFDNQRDGPQFETWRHLKSWLLIRAGRCTEMRFPIGSMTGEVAKALRQRFDFVEITKDAASGEIVLRFADSVSFDKMDSDDFTLVVDKCVELICERIVPGVEREQLMEMMRKGAA